MSEPRCTASPVSGHAVAGVLDVTGAVGPLIASDRTVVACLGGLGSRGNWSPFLRRRRPGVAPARSARSLATAWPGGSAARRSVGRQVLPHTGMGGFVAGSRSRLPRSGVGKWARCGSVHRAAHACGACSGNSTRRRTTAGLVYRAGDRDRRGHDMSVVRSCPPGLSRPADRPRDSSLGDWMGTVALSGGVLDSRRPIAVSGILTLQLLPAAIGGPLAARAACVGIAAARAPR